MGLSLYDIPSAPQIKDDNGSHPFSFQPPSLSSVGMIQYANQSHMTGLMAQMALLAKHAGQVYEGLLQEATSTYKRVTALQSRIVAAGPLVTDYANRMETITGASLFSNPRVQYAASENTDSSLFTVQNRPSGLSTIYQKATPPPNLGRMDMYMEAGCKALELYTSPRFFLDEWIQEQIKIRQVAKEERKRRREKRKALKAAGGDQAGTTLGVAQPKRLVKVQYDPLTGERIYVDAGEESSGANAYAAAPSTMQFSTEKQSGLGSAPSSIPSYSSPPQSASTPPAPAAAPYSSYSQPPPPPSFNSSAPPSFNTSPPPPPPPSGSFAAPPPPPSSVGAFAPPPPPPPSGSGAPPPPPAPSAPAPPPPPSAPGAPPPPSAPSGLLGQIGAGIQLKSAAPAPKKDAGSDLLAAIRAGRELKTVSVDEKEKKNDPVQENSVASILARRIAIQGSDSEDEEEDEEWD